MKNIYKNLSEIEDRIRNGCLLMLDFDGTLSALAKTPAQAFLSGENKKLLKKIGKVIPTAIVSGRGLVDIKQKVGVSGLAYAGNHGLEWEIKGKRGQIKTPAEMSTALVAVRKHLKNIIEIFPDSLVEDKGKTFSLHYRLVSPKKVSDLLEQTKKLLRPFQKKKLITITEGKKVLEVRPATHWNKGGFVLFFEEKLGKKLLPIYIGDDTTDEDAFKVLKKGITIKVGKSGKTKAKYCLQNHNQVTLFLVWLYKTVVRSRV